MVQPWVDKPRAVKRLRSRMVKRLRSRTVERPDLWMLQRQSGEPRATRRLDFRATKRFDSQGDALRPGAYLCARDAPMLAAGTDASRHRVTYAQGQEAVVRKLLTVSKL